MGLARGTFSLPPSPPPPPFPLGNVGKVECTYSDLRKQSINLPLNSDNLIKRRYHDVSKVFSIDTFSLLVNSWSTLVVIYGHSWSLVCTFKHERSYTFCSRPGIANR